MSEELIDEYIDRPAFKAETDFAVAEVNRLLGAFDSLKKAKVDISNGKGLTDISEAVRRSEKDTQLLLATQKKLAEVKLAEIKLDNELLRNAKLKQQEADRLFKQQQQQAAAKKSDPEFTIKTGGENDAENLKKTGSVVSELDKAQAEAAISATEFANAERNSTQAIKEHNQEQQKSTLSAKQLALAKAEGALVAQKEAAALKNQVREEIAVKGSLEQRRAALIRLNTVYDNQSPQERASAAGQRLQKIIGGLDDQVKTLEKNTGRSQRNVGNYASSFDKVKESGTKAYSALRTFANLVPGLGIGSAVLLILTPIQLLAEGISDLFDRISFGKEKVKALNEVNTKANEIFSKQKTEALALVSVIRDKTSSHKEQEAALQKLIDQAPEYLRGLTLQNIETAEGTRILDTYIESLRSKAELESAGIVNIEKNKEVDNLRVLKEELSSLRKAGKVSFDDLSEGLQKFLDNSTSAGRVKFTTSLFNLSINNSDLDQVGRNIDAAIKKASVTADASLSVYKDKFKKSIAGLPASVKGIIQNLRDELDKLNKELPTLLTEKDIARNLAQQKRLQDELDRLLGKTKKEKKIRQDHLQDLKEILNNEFKNYEIEQKRKIANYDRDLASDKVHFLDKIAILKEYYDANKELLEKQAQEEKRLALEKANAESQKLQEDKAGKSSAEIQRIDENIAIIEGNLAEQLTTINIKLQDDLIALAQTTADKKVKISEDHLKTEKDFLDQQLEYEEYTAKAIEKIRLNIANSAKAAKDKELELFKELQEKKIQAAETAEKALFSIGDGIYQKRLNQIKDEQNAIDIQKERELAANDARVQSEQDKAANIAIINQRAIDEKAKLDRKAKEIELQRARFDRAQQAFEIGINSIKAVAEIKAKAATLAASGNPLIAALAAKALAQIPLVLATSAASLVALFASPLPRLFRGKKKGQSISNSMAVLNDHPDGRTMEAIEREDGSIEFPEGRNTVQEIGVNDIVHPDRDAFVRSAIAAAHRDAGAGLQVKPKMKEDKVYSALQLQTKLLQQIARKPVSTTYATDRGLAQVMHWGATQIKYVDENTNW